MLLNYCISKKVKDSGFMNCSWREEQGVNTGKFYGSLQTIPKSFRVFPNELWDFSNISEKNSTFKKAQHLFLNSNILITSCLTSRL
jgi:hypothetical protein